MRTIIIGGVAAGTKVAAKLKRADRDTVVDIYSLSEDISYAGCGLPYFVGGSIKNREQLVVNSPSKFVGLTGANVHTLEEALSIYPDKHEVLFKSHNTGLNHIEKYDKLVIATGARPFIPSIKGVDLDGVFSVRTPDDAVNIREYIKSKNVKNAVVIGAGFIGMEMVENLMAQGIKVSLIDLGPQVLPNILDIEMADFVGRKLKAKGLNIYTGTEVIEINGDKVVQGVKTKTMDIPGELCIMCIGIKPNSEFLKDSGIELDRGTILVDEYQKTNLDDIYAAGDVCQVRNRITGNRQWSSMGSTANITGRQLALTLSGHDSSYPGCLGTGVCKLGDNLCIGRTGLSEQACKNSGIDIITSISVHDDKAHYYPGASNFFIKLIAEKETLRLLGMQVIGSGNVDKLTDIAVTLISLKGKVTDLNTMDLSYAPPFSTAIHPLVQAAFVLENKYNHEMDSITPVEFKSGKYDDYEIFDGQPVPTIKGAKWINLEEADKGLKGVDKDKKILVVCTKGKRAYLIQNKLKYAGYKNVKVLEGGVAFNF